MANWCFNAVTFSAEKEQLQQLEVLFITMQVKEIIEEKGQLPYSIEDEEGYFFEIGYEFSTVSYVTKCLSNIEIVKTIADRYQADFKYEYSETAMEIFGEATYQKGELSDVYLDADDFAFYEYEEEMGVYVFEGHEYEDDCEILSILLNRKKTGY